MTDVATRSSEPDVELSSPTREARLLPLVELRPPAPPEKPTRWQAAIRHLRQAGRRQRLFGLIVLAPIFTAAFYFFILAADRYEAEARYVVRNAALGASPAIGALLSPGSITRSIDDAYAVNAFILSQDAMRQIQERMDLRQILRPAALDVLWRFPRPFGSDSNEALFKRYKDLVDVKLDKTTGITSLKVQAFTPADAEALASQILAIAERFANGLSARARDDAVANARRDLDEAYARLQEAQERVTQFRNRERLVDPTRISNAVVETIARLSLEIAQTNAQINEIARSAGSSPQIAPLRARVSALEQQVQRERGQLAGTDRALAEKIAEYERLAMEKEFAEKLLSSAVNALESARLDVQRQQLYVERIVSPAQPDSPHAPYRIVSVLLCALACWSIFSIVRKLSSARRTQR